MSSSSLLMTFSLSLPSTHSQGIKAVIAESYERIHRSNLVGMGVVPLQFLAGETPATLDLTGRESYTITLPAELTPGMLADVMVCVSEILCGIELQCIGDTVSTPVSSSLARVTGVVLHSLSSAHWWLCLVPVTHCGTA